VPISTFIDTNFSKQFLNKSVLSLGYKKTSGSV